MSTLQFARRAKNIKTSPMINEETDQVALIKEYEIELAKLKNELERKNNGLLNDQIILQL